MAPRVYELNEDQYEIVYDMLSLTLASMMATTLFLWFRLGSIHEQHKSALLISGLVCFIAAYHYMRIFDSWTEAYEFASIGEDAAQNNDGSYTINAPRPSGVPFNDAYRYMDWLLTVPLLLMEIVLVMKLPKDVAFKKCTTLGLSSALMIIIGYPGELILEPEKLGQRWGYWAAALIPFVYIVWELTLGLKSALEEEDDNRIKNKIWWSQRLTIFSWLTYPFVYIIPMLGAEGAAAVVGIQIGYCFADIIAKCGVGLLIYQITLAKSRAAFKGNMDTTAPLVEA